MSILEIMEQSEQKRIWYVDTHGAKHTGFVDTFETRYDNDGEASICFADDSGERVIVEESDIREIRIPVDELEAKLA